jgi:hypothetical protein
LLDSIFAPVNADTGGGDGAMRPARPRDLEPEQLRHRLERAIQGAGGVAAVFARSGIPQSTLYRFLKGGKIPGTALVAIAGAAGVRVEWLLTGQEPIQGGAAVQASDPLSAVPVRRGSIRDVVDFEALVLCLELQEDLDRLNGGKIKSARSRLRRAFQAYDADKNDG